MSTSFLISFLLISSIFIQTTTLATQQGFTTRLIHRESPSSPLSTHSLDKYDRLKKSIQRSASRLNRFKALSSPSSFSPRDVQADVKSAQGEYLMELAYGTPPVRQLGIVDTGSDLIWTQCQPCKQCYKQDIPIYNPAKSSTYKTQSCSSEACQALDSSQASCSRKNVCTYLYGYGDRSHTSGDISTETITFNSGSGRSGSTSFRGITFGCGHDNAGTFGNEGSGLVGLGGGPLSLVSQLGTVGGKFSHCLIPFFKEGQFTSKISFGTIGEVSGSGVVSTPLVKGNPDTFYFLTLEGVTVGNSRIPFYKTEQDYGSSEGNIIIDSGTTLTLLPQDMYTELSSALEEAIQGQKAQDPSGSLQLCYQTTDGGQDLNIPNITAHFDGADVVLPPSNTFVAIANDVVCLAIVPGDAQLGAIWGNVAQMDFLVGYDTVDGKVSFKATDCTNA